jgi:hypothetical protein
MLDSKVLEQLQPFQVNGRCSRALLLLLLRTPPSISPP